MLGVKGRDCRMQNFPITKISKQLEHRETQLFLIYKNFTQIFLLSNQLENANYLFQCFFVSFLQLWQQTASGGWLVNFTQISLSPKSSSHQQQLFRLFLRLSVQLRAQSGRRSKVGEFRKLFLKKIRNSSKMKACMLTYLVYCLQRRIGNVCCADTKREWCSLTRPGFNQRPKVQRQNFQNMKPNQI